MKRGESNVEKPATRELMDGSSMSLQAESGAAQYWIERQVSLPASSTRDIEGGVQVGGCHLLGWWLDSYVRVYSGSEG